MTCIISLASRHTIWLASDRRLSLPNRAPLEHARKVMVLETGDGCALLGYAGLGRTALGTEPSDWMFNVLRGRNLPMDESLSVLAGAVQREFPRHLMRIGSGFLPLHGIIIPAFVSGKYLFYSIGLRLDHKRQSGEMRLQKWIPAGSGSQPPRLVVAGSAESVLMRDKSWVRPLLRLASASDRGQISPETVANQLARIIVDVSKRDRFTGMNSIVCWRNRKGGPHKMGGEHKFYDNGVRVINDAVIPQLTRGYPISDVCAALMPLFMDNFARWGGKGPLKPVDDATMAAAVSKIADMPDENLK